MIVKLIIENENEVSKYELSAEDSMMLGIELEEILRDHEIISEDEVVEIVDRIEAKRLHY